MAEPWYDPNTFGAWFGSIAGGGLGTLAGILSACTGVCATRGKGKQFVVGAWSALIAVGVVMLIFGLFALLIGQPWGIWYGPVLVGSLVAIVSGGMLPTVLRRYREAEHRRIDADGIRGG